VIRVSTVAAPRPILGGLTRNRPRAYAEWQALRRWNRLPLWERDVIGYRMRSLREAVGLTQKALAGRLGVTQQAVAQAERWHSNPTVDFLRRWAAACGAGFEIRLG
jgi:DNA-binding XRE family transcriptional regulator